MLNNHSCRWSLLQQEVPVKPLPVQLPTRLLVDLQWVGHGWQSFPMLYIKTTVQNNVRKLWPRWEQTRALLYGNIYRSHRSDLLPPEESFQPSGRTCQGNLQSPAVAIVSSAIHLCHCAAKGQRLLKTPRYVMKECFSYMCKRTEVRWLG